MRREPTAGNDSVYWDAEGGTIDRTALAKAQPDAVINLAGAPIAERWTPKRRRRIRDSRVNGTRALAQALAEMPNKPRAFISGSAIGYYGADRGDELLTEASSRGSGFLADIAHEWEQATAPAAEAGVRVVIARTGIVLAPAGGALQRMLPPFRLGLGGPLGSGRQWTSWITLHDTVRALEFLLESPSASGPVNLVAPDAVRNEAFAATLGRVLRRPAVVPVPAFALELLFGTMARQTILASQRVLPQRLASAGFECEHPHLEAALRAVLRR